jgi:hypothetical protein
MKIREAGGAVMRANQVQVFCLVSETTGIFLPISKPQARLLLDAARDAGDEEVDCELVGTVCRLGVEHDMEDDAEAGEPILVCSTCSEPWEPDHEC